MRKVLVCLALAALLMSALPALAQTVNVDSAYAITLPDDMKAADLTPDEKVDGLMADMKSDALQAVVYEYDPDPSYAYTIDDMYQDYLADQQEGLFASVAIEEINGEKMLVYDGGDGTIGAKAIAKNGKTYEFIMICLEDSARDAAKAAIESIKAQ